MKKVDIVKGLKNQYPAGQKIKEVVAERGLFLCIDGTGEPDGNNFKKAVEQLYTVARKIKSQLKKSGRLDFKLSKLEFRRMSGPREKPKSERTWRLMVRIPDEITKVDLKEARKLLQEKKALDISAVKRVSWREGRALQVMHTGPYEKGEDTYNRLRARADELGYRIKGPGHEIYIGNPKKMVPGKLKRIMFLPIAWPRPDYARGR